VNAVVGIGQLRVARGGAAALPGAVEKGQGVTVGQVGLAERFRCLRAKRQGPAVGESRQDAAHAGRPRPDKMPPHTTENVAERLACHVPEGQGHQVARAELAASVDVEVRQARARRPHDEAGAVVEGAADLAQVLPQQRLAPRERHDCGAPVLQLRCELADHLEGEVLPAAARIVAVPAAEAAAVCDGKGDGVEARRVVHQKVIQETLEGAAGIGRKLGVDDTLAPEGDDLFPRQVVLEKGGDAGVQLGQRRAGCYLLEELVSAHRAALGGQVLTYTFL